MKVPAKTAPEFRMRPVASRTTSTSAASSTHLARPSRARSASPGDRGLYSATGANYRQLPIGVVIPKSLDDVIATVAACREHGAPLLSRGGGTGLAGQTTNVAVVIDFSKYLNRIVEIDPEQKLARVEPGLILDHLRKQAEQEHQLDVRAGPLDARVLHLRRDDREQLLRRPLGDGPVLRPGPAHLGQRPRARLPALRRPPPDRRARERPATRRSTESSRSSATATPT